MVTAMREQGLAEIYAVDTASGQERRLTDFNDAYFSGHKTEAPESFSYVSKNGYTMKGFVLFRQIMSREGNIRLFCPCTAAQKLFTELYFTMKCSVRPETAIL